MRKKILMVAGALLLAGAGAWFLRGKPGSYTPSTLHVGDTVSAELPLTDSTGNTLKMGEYKGKVLLVNFWASWCTPCMVEMPAIYKAYDKLKEKGFVVLGVNLDDDFSAGLAKLKARVGDPPFPIIKGTDSEIFRAFDIEGVPFTAIVDRQGKVQFAEPGVINWNSKEGMELLGKYL